MDKCPNCNTLTRAVFAGQVSFQKHGKRVSSREVKAKCQACGKIYHLRFVQDGKEIHRSAPFLPDHTRAADVSYRRLLAAV